MKYAESKDEASLESLELSLNDGIWSWEYHVRLLPEAGDPFRFNWALKQVITFSMFAYLKSSIENASGCGHKYLSREIIP